jgi:hypothetical protein
VKIEIEGVVIGLEVGSFVWDIEIIQLNVGK